MKIICAWCGKTLGHKCPFCGEPLKRDKATTLYKCVDCIGGTTIYFDEKNMKATHTICDACRKGIDQKRPPRTAANLSTTDARSINALDGYGNRGETPWKGDKPSDS